MIHMENVSKRYIMGSETINALDNVSFDIAQGEFVAITGPSGSGKSTLMNIIGCLDLADEGVYMLDGQPIESYSERQLARIRNTRIGFIFQGFNLLGRLSALENVELPLIYQNMKSSQRRARTLEVLEKVGLADRVRHRPNEMSGGQQQRAAVARALAAGPSLILADEPTGNLDRHTGWEIMDLFDKLNEQGNTIVLITHDPAVAGRARRQIHMEDGHIRSEEGTA